MGSCHHRASPGCVACFFPTAHPRGSSRWPGWPVPLHPSGQSTQKAAPPPTSRPLSSAIPRLHHCRSHIWAGSVQGPQPGRLRGRGWGFR